jgi:hypothetical protein
MTRVELSPGGYGRITEKIRSVQDAVNRGLFEGDAARRCLLEAGRGLRELTRTLEETCLIVPGKGDPPGPGAA